MIASFLYLFSFLILNIIPVAYIGLMVYFLVSDKPKLKLAGKIMAGILIGIFVIFIIFFITCTGLLFGGVLFK